MVRYSSLDIGIIVSVIIATAILLIFALIYSLTDWLAFGYEGPSLDNTDNKNVSIETLLAARTVKFEKKPNT